jgi:DNA replication protein DnaC
MSSTGVPVEAVKALAGAVVKSREIEKAAEQSGGGKLLSQAAENQLQKYFIRRAAETANSPALPDPEEDARRRQRIAALWKDADVPARYATAGDLNFDHLPSDAVEDYCLAFSTLLTLEKIPATVAMLGPRGVGKTAMACGLIKRFIAHERSARYCRTLDIFIDVKQTFRPDSKSSERDVQRRYERYELLVIDELSVRVGSGWEELILTNIIDQRYASNRATVLISNELPSEFLVRIGSSVADRITDGGGLIECRWQSLRGRIKNTKPAAVEASGQ